MIPDTSQAVYSFLARLRELDIQLSVDGDRLRCNAPAGVITPEIRQKLLERKDAIIGHLRLYGQDTLSSSAISNDREGAKSHILSFAQQRLWFLDQMDVGSFNYNIWGMMWLEGVLKISALEGALSEIIRRHECLRSSFISDNGNPRVEISQAREWNVDFVDLTHNSVDAGKKQAIQIAKQEGQRPFDLSKGPLVRASVMRLAENLHGLFLCVHHIVSDGISLGIFIKELQALYEAYSVGKPSPLPRLPLQYGDYARWQREKWESGEMAGQLEYWKKQLGGRLPVLDFPADHVRPAIQTFHGSRVVVEVSPELTEVLKELSRRERRTFFMTLVAAFKVLVFRHTGAEDVIVGSPIAGRTRPEFESLMGFFVNTLVLRTDLSGNPSFRELLSRVCGVALQAYNNQDVPFDKLVEALRPE
jgi:hypothetical protein